MSNVLNEQEKQQVIALGRLGWSLRRTERETDVRRETASAYRKTGIPVASPGRRKKEPPAKPANAAHGVTTDSETAKPGQPGQGSPSSASTCEAFREAIELGLRHGRNAMGIWQDLVSQAGFSGGYHAVKRFVCKLRGSPTAEACAVIMTPPLGRKRRSIMGAGRRPVTPRERQISTHQAVCDDSRL